MKSQPNLRREELSGGALPGGRPAVCPSVCLSVNRSAGMGHISSGSSSSQPPQGPRQSRRWSDCQPQSLAWRASCQPDNVLRQLRETQSLSFGGIGQREKDSLSWVCGAAEGGVQEKGCDSWGHKVCSQNRSGDIMSGMGPRAQQEVEGSRQTSEQTGDERLSPCLRGHRAQKRWWGQPSKDVGDRGIWSFSTHWHFAFLEQFPHTHTPFWLIGFRGHLVIPSETKLDLNR